MKWLISILLALTVAVVAALVAKDDPGYVMLAYGKWSIEMSVVMLMFLTAVTFTSLYYGIRFLANVKQIPKRTSDWHAHRRQNKASDELTRGLIALVEGQWKNAEKTLLKHAQNSHAPLINYIAAAHAAQESGDQRKRDEFLLKAHRIASLERNIPTASIAVEMTQAELLLRQKQYEQALASIEHLRQIAPKNNQVLKLLIKLKQRLQDWDGLRQILPLLAKQKVLPDAELHSLSINCYNKLLQETEDLTAILKIWAEMPKHFRNTKKLLLLYSSRLLEKNSSQTAEPLLKEAINIEWDQELVSVYGLVNSGDNAKQLNTAELWLKNHDKDPQLMLTLARLCLRNQLWGKARDYLEVSVNNGGPAQAYNILAQLLERLGEPENALALYRKGLDFSVGVPEVELPRPVEQNEPGTLHHRLTVIGE